MIDTWMPRVLILLLSQVAHLKKFSRHTPLELACFKFFFKKDPDSIKEQVFVYLSLMKSRHENQARKKRSSQLSSLLTSCCDTRICSMLHSAQCYRNENINTERALRTCS